MFFLGGMNDILGFSNFLYLPQISQYNFFIVLAIENTLVLFYYFIKLLPFNIKQINSTRKYLHIIESYAYILQIFVMIFLFPMNF